MYSAYAERDVPFGRDVDFVSDVRFAREKSGTHHITLRQGCNTSLCVSTTSLRRSRNFTFFNSKVFRNFVDAFPCRALLAHHFGSVDRFEPAKAFLREEGGTRSVTEGACATLKFD